jgi:hypothetical protein
MFNIVQKMPQNFGISNAFTAAFPYSKICSPVAVFIIIIFVLFVVARDNLTVKEIDSQLNLSDAHTHHAISSINLSVAVAVSLAIMSVVFIETAVDVLFIKHKLRVSKNIDIQYLLLAGSSVVVGGSAVIVTYCVWGEHVMVFFSSHDDTIALCHQLA